MNTSDYDIILLGLFRWNGPYSSISIAMAKEFAKANRVFYINHPFSIKDYYKGEIGLDKSEMSLFKRQTTFQKAENIPGELVSVTPPLTLPINVLPKGIIYNTTARYNHRLIHQAIQKTIQKYKIKQYIYINCFDPFYVPVLPKKFHPTLNIYQSVDDISQSEYTARHGVYLEEAAIQKADLTLVTSKELYKLKSLFSEHIHILNNAADTSNFKKALEIDYPKPAALQSIKGKIIGYIGNLDESRVNYPLLKKTALAHPDKTLLLVGPINNTIYKEIGLDQLPNVIFTGGMSIEALPPYLKYFDCAIIPFNCNTLTKSIYPLKINEYLAAGKAVVATNFSEDIQSFKDHIYLANAEDTFVKMVEEAVNDASPEKIKERVLIAEQNTWTARIKQFWEIVENHLSN